MSGMVLLDKLYAGVHCILHQIAIKNLKWEYMVLGTESSRVELSPVDVIFAIQYDIQSFCCHCCHIHCNIHENDNKYDNNNKNQYSSVNRLLIVQAKIIALSETKACLVFQMLGHHLMYISGCSCIAWSFMNNQKNSLALLQLQPQLLKERSKEKNQMLLHKYCAKKSPICMKKCYH